MAGEISNLYNTGLYGQNLYSTNNNDFLAQQYFAQQTGQGQYQPAFQGYQQPQTDTFQKSSGSGFGTGLTLGTVAGLGTSAGVYFLGTNPIKDGQFNDDILKNVERNNLQQARINKATELLSAKKQEILKKAGAPDGVSLKTLKAYAKTGIPSSFPKLHGILTQEQAAKIYKAAKKEIKNIDLQKLANEAVKLADQDTLEAKQKKLSNLKQQKVKLEGLADDAELEKFFKDNAKSFGIEGDEKAIETEAQKLAAKYKNKAGAIADYTTQISNQEAIVQTTKNSLNSKVALYYDEATKSLKANTPDNIKSAFKNFKWKNAGKWGAIAAGAGLVLGWLFGGTNKS